MYKLIEIAVVADHFKKWSGKGVTAMIMKSQIGLREREDQVFLENVCAQQSYSGAKLLYYNILGVMHNFAPGSQNFVAMYNLNFPPNLIV
jgi:hypothetical protein